MTAISTNQAKLTPSNRERLGKIIADALEPLIAAADAVQTFIQSLNDSQVLSLAQTFLQEAVTAGLKYSTTVLANHGWFLDIEFPAAGSVRVADLYEAGEMARADRVMADYYRDQCDRIYTALIEVYPKRESILRKAFRFHKAGEFDVSVPLFLIQADGICREIFGREFFCARKGELAVRRSIRGRQIDWTWEAVIEPFAQIPPVARASFRGNHFNRNRILRGASLTYDTEANSLRAISLVAYLHGLGSYAEGRTRSGRSD